MKEVMSHFHEVALGGTHLELVEGWRDTLLLRGGGEINNRKGVIE
jgi:hypothetical protein